MSFCLMMAHTFVLACYWLIKVLCVNIFFELVPILHQQSFILASSQLDGIVKCVLHKFPYLESSDTLKINPKSKPYFVSHLKFYLHIIYYTNYLYYIISIFIFLFTLIIGLKHLNRTFSLFTLFKSFKSF